MNIKSKWQICWTHSANNVHNANMCISGRFSTVQQHCNVIHLRIHLHRCIIKSINFVWNFIVRFIFDSNREIIVWICYECCAFAWWQFIMNLQRLFHRKFKGTRSKSARKMKINQRQRRKCLHQRILYIECLVQLMGRKVRMLCQLQNFCETSNIF